jgi:hypothetical protein
MVIKVLSQNFWKDPGNPKKIMLARAPDEI